MKGLARFLLPLSLCCALLPARAGDAPPMPQMPPERPGHAGIHHKPPQDMTPEERAAWREARRARREQWRQMSPEERHQLRHDIREAGHDLYRRAPRRDD